MQGVRRASSPFISAIEGEVTKCDLLSREPSGEVWVGELEGLGSLGVKLSMVPPATQTTHESQQQAIYWLLYDSVIYMPDKSAGVACPHFLSMLKSLYAGNMGMRSRL